MIRRWMHNRWAGPLPDGERMIRAVFNTNLDGWWMRPIAWFADNYPDPTTEPLWVKVCARPFLWRADWESTLAMRKPVGERRRR